MLNQGEGAVLYCFIILFMAAADGGIWSVDAARRVFAEAARGTGEGHRRGISSPARR